MSIEIEKKYRLTKDERESVLARLRELGAQFVGQEFEENTIYTGGAINIRNCVLRLRRVGGSAILTFKERFPSSSAIKRQREDETRVDDADAMADILEGIGFQRALVYEKRRATWRFAETEVVVDDLPFGLFMEIEGEEKAIENAEKLLGLKEVKPELATYPQLTAEYGQEVGFTTEARFDQSLRNNSQTRSSDG